MKTLILVGKMLMVIFAMVLLHLGAAYLLPYPWDSLNIMFMLLVVLIVVKETGIAVWLAYVGHFFIELYATTPFGVILFSSTISILCTFWLSRSIFINKSWYTAFVLAAIALFIYRLIYSTLLGILTLVQREGSLPWPLLIHHYVWELLLTSAAVGAVSLIFVHKKSKTQAFILFR